MGFDIFAMNDKTPTPTFYANIWFWRPLWQICSLNKNFLSQKDIESGHFNDGYEINEEKALSLSDHLTNFLARDDVDQRVTEIIDDGKKDDLDEWVRELKKVIKEFSDFCTTSGGFCIH